MLFSKELYTIPAAVAEGETRTALYRDMASGQLPYKMRGDRRILTGEALRKRYEDMPAGVPGVDPLNRADRLRAAEKRKAAVKEAA